MKTKIFITGSSGFIGFHVAKRYLDKGFKVHGFDSMNKTFSAKISTSLEFFADSIILNVPMIFEFK